MKKILLLIIICTAVTLMGCLKPKVRYDFTTEVIYANGDVDTIVCRMESRSNYEPEVYLGSYGNLSVADGYGSRGNVTCGVRKFKVLETVKTPCKE